MQPNPADEILPGLWLGSIVAAGSGEFLITNNISCVFNCTKNIPFHEAARRRYRIPVDDNLEEDEIRNMELWGFEAVYRLIQEYKKGPVLVHCHAGMQRSACIIAMFLIAVKGQKVEDSILFIKRRRPIAFTPSVNFIKAIQGFERTFDRDVRPNINSKQESYN
jgi:hypothetical protein